MWVYGYPSSVYSCVGGVVTRNLQMNKPTDVLDFSLKYELIDVSYLHFIKIGLAV